MQDDSLTPEPELTIRRRVLPHWRLTGSAYFVTWRLRKDQASLSDQERGIVSETIRYGNSTRYELYAFVVMDDHVHVAFRPLAGHETDKIIHTWKSYSAHRLQRERGRLGGIWVTESWDRIMRDEDELIEKCTYILNNPQKRWPDIQDYLWVGWE
jgi:putative transposase